MGILTVTHENYQAICKYSKDVSYIGISFVANFIHGDSSEVIKKVLSCKLQYAF